jgi:hypothetical protein
VREASQCSADDPDTSRKPGRISGSDICIKIKIAVCCFQTCRPSFFGLLLLGGSCEPSSGISRFEKGRAPKAHDQRKPNQQLRYDRIRHIYMMDGIHHC